MLTHLGVKSFVPVFERTHEVYDFSKKAIYERGGFRIEPRYKRWGYNFWEIRKTSNQKKLWAIVRVKRERAGQLRLM
jgi:hypothetical protein